MEKHYFNIIEKEQQVTVEIYGTIGESWWDEGVTFKGVSDQLKDIAAGTKKVLVKINSYGGDVNDALAIYEMLHSMGDRVTTECVGFCASAATIIAMAGHVRRMSSYGLFLVHKCSSGVWGNENDMEAELEAQRKINDRIVTLYQDVTGTDRAKLEDLMNEDNGNGIWLNVDEAIEYGFITEAMPDTKEDIRKKAFYENMFKKLFNNHKKLSDMKKSITTFAALVALLATNELEAKDSMFILDEDQLKKINDTLAAKDAEIEQLKTDKDAAESKVVELQAIVDKMPKQDPPAGASDTKPEEKSFEDWYLQQGYVQEAKVMLGR